MLKALICYLLIGVVFTIIAARALHVASQDDDEEI